MEPIVDAHTHFLPAGAIAAAAKGGEWYGTSVERNHDDALVLTTGPRRIVMQAPGYFEGPAARVERLAAAGVDMQIVSVTPMLYRYEIDAAVAVPAAREVNDELADWTRAFPQHYRGFATLPLQDVDASVAELERAVNQLGLVGAIVDTHVAGRNWDDPALLNVVQAAEALGAVLFIHPGYPRVAPLLPRHQLRNLIGNPFETTVAVASLIFGGVLDAVPDLAIVCAHGGGFLCADAGRLDHGYTVRADAREHARLLPSEYLRGLYYDSLTNSEPALRYLLDVAGRDRVVLGSDYPANMGPAQPAAWVRSCGSLTSAEQDDVLGGTVARLLARLGHAIDRSAAGAGKLG